MIVLIGNLIIFTFSDVFQVSTFDFQITFPIFNFRNVLRYLKNVNVYHIYSYGSCIKTEL